MFVHETTLRVRYGETDQMGMVYYGNYALYYEVGRVEALRMLGMSYRELEEGGVLMPVVEMSSRFLKPARYDDELTVRTTIDRMPEARISFEYELLNSGGEVLNTGTVTLVFISKETGRPTRCPAELFQKLQPFFTRTV